MKVAITKTIGRFMASRAYVRRLRGPRGEGKTTGALMDWIRLSEEVPDPLRPYRVIVVRDTWANMQRTTLDTIREWEQKGLAVQWLERDTEAVVGGNRVRFFFLGMDTVKDLNKFQGLNAGGLWIQEPAPAADVSGGLNPEVFGLGITSIRQVGVPHRCTIDMNPPDEEHWSEKLEPILKRLRRENPALQLTMETFDLPRGENPHISMETRDIWRAALEMAGRGDLVGRLILGQVGFVQLGEACTPEYADALHLADRPLRIVEGEPIIRLWDFGGNPTCLWTQLVPTGFWNVLGARVGENMGMEQFVQAYVLPWEKRFLVDPRDFEFRDIGDPAGNMREQSNSEHTAVRVLQEYFPDLAFEPGPVDWDSRIQAAKSVLGGPTIRGRGRVRIDPEEARAVRNALRGGAHYPKDDNGVPIMSAKAMKRASGIHCVDGKTEILTERGWRHHSDLVVDEPVWGYDLHTKRLRATPLKAVHRFDRPTPVTRFVHQTFDMVVTDEHRCLVRKRNTDYPGVMLGPVRVVYPAQFTDATYLMRAATVARAKPSLSDAFVRLCAWAWTEGCYRPADEGLGVRIVQSLDYNPTYCDEIDALLRPYGTAITMSTARGGINGGRIRLWSILGDLAWAIRQAMPDKVNLSPAFLNRLSVEQLRLFLYEAIRGDGTWQRSEGPLPPPADLRHFWIRSSVPRLFQKRKEGVDQIQAVASLAGIVTAIHPKKAGIEGWSISFLRRAASMCVNSCTRERDELPFVWCPETGTGTWVARRNGHVFLTGNSHPFDCFCYGAAVLFRAPSMYERHPRAKAAAAPAGRLAWMAQ